MFQKIKKYQFLFEELVKRDFKQKYKRTVLGMAWSVLSPLLQLLIMRIVFSQFFGREIAHYTTYLFCGNLIFSYFKESTMGGMNSLLMNADIFSKVNIPKYMFLLSKNVSSLINFGCTLLVFFLFCLIDGIRFHFGMLTLIYPLICLILFNVGIGLILSALYVFFRDISYLYDVFTMLLTYVSAIFYTVDTYPMIIQNLFLLNPVYVFIKYWRIVIIDAAIPSFGIHFLCGFYALLAVCAGAYIYRKYNHKFLYYV
ncbi:MAG: ABC transporter permease [Erysipelotrichaceae bacterium]|nr:ABC transporter permease [Erysipelotrichaceae bacterium]